MEGAFHKHLYVIGKEKYLHGERPNVKCILCSIVKNDPKVKSLKLYESDYHIIVLNIYPYASGHILIFPKRHIIKMDKYKKVEWNELHILLNRSMKIIGKEYKTDSFNIGWNIGPYSGGSIEHIHIHIVPRFKSEVGFVELISGTKLILETPDQTYKRLLPLFKIIKL